MQCGYWNKNLAVLFPLTISRVTGIWRAVSYILQFDEQLSQIIHFLLIKLKISVVIALVSRRTVRHQTYFLLQKLPVAQNTVTNRCTVVLFSTSLSGYSLFNSWRRTAHDSDVKCSSERNCFCTWIQYFRTCRALVTRRDPWCPYIECHKEVAMIYCKGVNVLIVQLLYRSM